MNDRNEKVELRDSDDHGPKETVGAVFGSREEAHQALGALHKAHFRKVWFGVTSIGKDSRGEETVTAESGSGGILPNTRGLVDALVAHGLSGDIARRIEAEIEPGEAIVTVETKHHDPSEAISILEDFGGRTERSGMRATAPVGSGRQGAERRDRAQSISEDVDLPAWEEETFFMQRR